MSNVTITHKTLSDERIIELNNIRHKPCLNEWDGCYIVTCYRIEDYGKDAELTDCTDVNVFATEDEAWQSIADKALNYVNAENDESCCITKHTYSVRYHHVRR